MGDELRASKSSKNNRFFGGFYKNVHGAEARAKFRRVTADVYRMVFLTKDYAKGTKRIDGEA